MQHAYWENVVQYTCSELRAGFTPSPDVMCNTLIKFGAFVDYLHLHAQMPPGFMVASGHYAKTIFRNNENDDVALLRAADIDKDQTYFLSRLRPDQLRLCLFPLGGLQKQEVRNLAIEWGLPNAARKDSQGICFLGKIPYDEFIKEQLGSNPGLIKEWGSQKILGKHQGFWFHTIGQRKGLGLGGGPWFVVKKDVVENTIFVASDQQRSQIPADRFVSDEIHWLNKPRGLQPLELKLRHGPKLIGVLEYQLGKEQNAFVLQSPDFGIAPGQFAVLYEGMECLGGARISWQSVPKNGGIAFNEDRNSHQL
jgi:tRNA-specific 2-thiouridylase